MILEWLPIYLKSNFIPGLCGMDLLLTDNGYFELIMLDSKSDEDIADI